MERQIYGDREIQKQRDRNRNGNIKRDRQTETDKNSIIFFGINTFYIILDRQRDRPSKTDRKTDTHTDIQRDQETEYNNYKWLNNLV